MREFSSVPSVRLLLAVLAPLALGPVSPRAEDIIVTSTLDSSGTLTPCPPSCCDNLGTTTTSATYSTAVPAGIAPRKTRFGVSTNATWTVTPNLTCTGGTYKVYVTKGTTGSCPTDIHVNIVATSGCTLYDTNSVAAPLGIDTPYFQKQFLNEWYWVGSISNSSPTPTITFSWASGGSNRWYMDEVRFETICDPCCGVAPPVGITGPLAAGQDYVNVTRVSTGATNITVYANRTTVIGWTNYAPGFATGTVSVPTVLPLIKGDMITATQTRLNAAGQPCTSDQPLLGPIVGGGANPRMNISLGCVQNAAFTGPVGTPTTGSGTLYWLKANGRGFEFHTGPRGGWVVTPGTCWQTFYFDWATDPCWNWLTGIELTETNSFAALESLAIGMDDDDLDSGPYDLYIDEIMNGTNVIADFEGFPNTTPNVHFANPNAAPIPPPSSFLSAPISTRIAQNNAFSGTNSCRVRWQFLDNYSTRWCRLLFNQPPLAYPQLDTHQPVTVRLLALPVGSNTCLRLNGIVGTALTYSGGGGSQFVLLKSAGLATPLNAWTRVATNTSTPGSFAIPAVGTGTSVFYRIKSQ